MAPQLAPDLSALSERRISRQTVYKCLIETGLNARHPVLCVTLTATNRIYRFQWSLRYKSWTPLEWRHVLFSDELRFTKQSYSCRVFTWRESRVRFHSSSITKIVRFGDNAILVRSSIMLNSRTTLYVLDAGTVN
ncbi:transposable element Tc1 transposase [Trichonephila clavipes]|nr:transposable element Tc1 transposase [Trichonephila clavipes]